MAIRFGCRGWCRDFHPIHHRASQRFVVAIDLCVCCCIGCFFIGHFLLQTLLVWPIGCLNAKAGKGVALLLTFVLLTALVTDTFVYQQYRFHINWPMIDLAIVGGREVFSFSSGMMLRIALLTGAVALLTGLLLWLSSVFQRKIRVRWFCAVILLGYVVVNGVNAYSVSQSVRSVTVLTERIPLYYPIRANRLLAKFGLVAVKEDSVKLSSQEGSFRYPLHPLQLGKGTDLNVLILAIDSLRADVVDEKTMPNLTKIKSQSISFVDHYSAGNATRAGVFWFVLRTASFLLAKCAFNQYSLGDGFRISAGRL